jgi:hypothetical protein
VACHPVWPITVSVPALQALSDESARLSVQQEQLASQQQQVTAAVLRASSGGGSPSAAAAVAARAASLAAREAQLVQQQQQQALTEQERSMAQVSTWCGASALCVLGWPLCIHDTQCNGAHM